tara:strand:- start:4733 stop:5308 length:576 start_codon:yes stop_codon:yes gene_type:complete
MLEYNEIKERRYIIVDGSPYEVLSSHVFRKQQRKPVNQTKLRNFLTGKVTERSFHQSEKVEEADITIREIKYLYKNPKNDEYWFSDPNNPKDRFTVPVSVIEAKEKFLRENDLIEGLVFDNQIIGLRFPIKIDLKVIEAPPSEKGNTAQGGTKQVILETGATVNAPLFINEGDIVRINTDTGEYVERAEKR